MSIPATVDAYSRTWYADFTCDPGDHVTGWKVRNLGGPAGLLAVLFEVTADAEGKEVLTQVWRTGDGAWRVNSYPSSEPGWTLGNILNQLLSEANARAVPSIQRLTPTFTTAVDSESVNWPRVAWKTSVGTPMLDAFRELRDFGLDLWVNPDTLRLNAYVSRGVANPDVLIDIAAHVQDLTEETEAAISNVLLISTGDQWAGATDTTSRATYGRIEAYADLSRFTAEQAVEVSQAILDRAKIPTEGVEVTYVPVAGNTPWTDFSVGDTISVSTTAGYRSRVVSSISVTFDAAGEAVWTVELDTIFRDLLAKLQRIIDQAGLANGSVAGQAGDSGSGSNGGGDAGGGWAGGGTGGDDFWNGDNYIPEEDWPGGGDDSWSWDDYLAGPGWTEGDPYGENLPGFSGGGGAGPVLSPPGGDPGGTGGTTPWLPPTDPGGGTGSLDPAPPGNAAGAGTSGIGKVSANLATAMHASWGTTGTLSLALLIDAPTETDGVFDLTGCEQTGDGYARRNVLASEWAATTGANPVLQLNRVPFKFEVNSGATDWPPIIGVALMGGTTVLSWVPFSRPVIVTPTYFCWLPVGYVSVEVTSA